MTRGRKPLEAPEIIDLESTLDQPRIGSAMTVMQANAVQEQEETLSGIFALGRFVGVAQMADTLITFSAAAKIRAFEEVNKSKVFKSLPIRHPNGDFRPAENIDEFCKLVFGRGYKSMADHKVMLERLGEEAYENANRLGLNRSQLRLLLTMPEDERSAVEDAMKSGEKSEVVGLIQSLANKLDETRAEVEELKGDVKAKEEVLSRRAQQVDALEEKLARVKILPPDEVLAELHQEATTLFNDTRGALIGKFSAAVAAIDAHHQEQGGDSQAYLAGLVGQLQADLAALRDRFGIPDVVPALVPEWVNDPSFADFKG